MSTRPRRTSQALFRNIEDATLLAESGVDCHLQKRPSLWEALLMNDASMATQRRISALLVTIPVLIGIWIWFSPLSFVPVPWPDDSAFYFVGREFWKWPPRWVMLPQAPFEPTYRIFNFNTM